MKQENPTSNPISASQIPPEYTYIIDTLIYHGYKAYLVGGCVRDLLLNLQPKDYDITTNATPEQVTSIFSPLFKILPTGISHGTVTLLQNNSTNFTCEVTTFRNDGKYLDNRRPSSVEFTDDLHTDLSRRDFTINAMAYNHHEGLIDPFHGIYDLQNNNIRCVGNSTERFQEDALRMMRAIRFAARFDFKICLSTAEAIYQNAHLIKNISMERIQSELNQILLTNPEYIHTLSGLNLLQYTLP
jgi:tRNA nucleotidyltransferase (CCA-adding enzyme)